MPPEPVIAIVVVAGMLNADGNANVIVVPVVTAVPKFAATVQFEVAFATFDPGVNRTPVVVPALANVAVPSSAIAMTTMIAVNLFTRLIGLKRDVPSCPTTE